MLAYSFVVCVDISACGGGGGDTFYSLFNFLHCPKIRDSGVF